MSRPLTDIKVIEVSMWAFVPSCGAVLSDWGADVVRVEPPEGDPIRQLTMSGIPPGHNGLTFMWEIFNRGKRSVAIDLRAPGAREILYRLVEQADVFLCSILVDSRKRLGIDVEDIRAVNPGIIYAAGSGQGAFGPEAANGGYDAMTFWARGGISAALTPEGHHPIGMPTGAFGDSLSGAVFAGGIAAAIAHKRATGEGGVVDGALLATAMWAMQPGIVGSSVLGVDALPGISRSTMPNVLVGSYRTKDGRFVALNMLQPDRYWPGFCEVAERPELVDHPKFGTHQRRAQHLEETLALMDEIFARWTLVEWRERLSRQSGQWDVLKLMGELNSDPQATANSYIQNVDYGDGRHLNMVSAPVQFDRQVEPLRPAPQLGQHTEEVLLEAGFDWDRIIEAKVSGAVA
jgi:crotonobetainyl-CoA:carnitine CoA-transferase CaiB-like acyl-CoA transferase